MMDPYSILNISPSATDQEIKKAYRTLSKKYHPDANVDNPNAAQYEEKFKQVQEAYQQIMDERNGKQTSYQQGFHTHQDHSTGSEEDLRFQAAINFIRNHRFEEALHVLNDMEDRSAKWYYISAITHSAIGNNATAIQYAKTAVQLEPKNYEYQNLLQQLQLRGSHYQNMQHTYMGGTDVNTDSCMRCCMANLLINLCCGCTDCC